MSNDAHQPATRVPTYDGALDPYDHEISLIDATASPDHDEQHSASPSPSWRQLAKRPTKNSFKDHLARRKYAKWQEDRRSSRPSSVATDDDQPSSSTPQATQSQSNTQPLPDTQAVDFAPEELVERGRRHPARKPPGSKELKPQPREIDVLYENQRGAFVCGIPLYSNSSLMPVDPSPWLNKDFRESPVNITNAQVPDPSWEWAWKSWYVDMSYDVDEEGWQYSFAFGHNFAWHGTHPWFHSFVRRRRWLRKRVKKPRETGSGKPGSLGAAHNLTGDYFTIHSRRDRSPGSTLDVPGKIARPGSYLSSQSTVDLDVPPEDVKDIASLLKALRFASIDREKIEVIKKFVEQGGEELAYLQHHIPDIMAFLVFQNSRRQLLLFLQESANEARRHRQEHEKNETAEGDAEHRRIDNLLAAVDTANTQICGLEYWSDRKDVLKIADDDAMVTQAISTIFDEPAPRPKSEDDPVREIKGISKEAEINEKDTSVTAKPTTGSTHEPAAQSEVMDKGKERAHDSEDDQVEESSDVRLKTDQLLIPNQD